MRIYRLPPCPAYDIESTESWLESMALKGLFLKKNGFFAGIAAFEKSTPRAVRYRLDAAPEHTGICSDNGGAPDEEAVAISKSYGWNYIARRGQFYIYASEHDNAREFHTDPKIQAITLDMVRKRERNSLFSTLFWLTVYPLLLTQGGFYPVMTAISLGTPLYLLGILLIFGAVAGSLKEVAHLHNLRKRLSDGKLPDHHKNWKKHAGFHRTLPLLFISLLLIWTGAFFRLWYAEKTDKYKISLEYYDGAVPFPTIKDLVPDGTYSLTDFGFGNTIELKTDPLAPSIVTYTETGSVRFADNQILQGGLIINYYDTVSPWLAQELAHEYQRYDKHRNKKYYEVLKLPDLGSDYAAAYNAVFPTLILTDGSRMMHITFYQTSGNYTMPLEEWAEIYVKAIKQTN